MARSPVSLVALPHRFSISEGRTKNEMGDVALNIISFPSMRGESGQGFFRAVYVRGLTNLILHHREQTHNKTNTGVSTHIGVQFPSDDSKDGDRSTLAQPDFDSVEGIDDGDAENDRMEFEGRGEVTASL